MRKIACLPDDDRRELFRNTADKMGLNDAIVEKVLLGYALPWIIYFTAVHGKTPSLLRVEQAFQKHLI